MTRNFLSALCMVAALAVQSCGGDKGHEAQPEVPGSVGTEHVANPATAEGTAATGDAAKFEFQKDVHDFGDIMQGEKVSYNFKFKNSGNADLLITSARGSCGCTVPEYPKEPIAPGAEGTINVIFDSTGKTGQQNKKVTIVANTVPSTTVISINGNVIAPEK